MPQLHTAKLLGALILASATLCTACGGDAISGSANQHLGNTPSPHLINNQADPSLAGMNADPSLSGAGISPGQSGQSATACGVLDMGCACSLLISRFSACGLDELTNKINEDCQKLDARDKFLEECSKNRLSVDQCWTLTLDWLDSCDANSCVDRDRCGQAPQQFIKPVDNGNNGNGNGNK